MLLTDSESFTYQRETSWPGASCTKLSGLSSKLIMGSEQCYLSYEQLQELKFCLMKTLSTDQAWWKLINYWSSGCWTWQTTSTTTVYVPCTTLPYTGYKLIAVWIPDSCQFSDRRMGEKGPM